VVALLPMRSVVLFPHVLMPITIGRKCSLAVLRHAVEGEAPLGILLQRDAQVGEPGFEGLCAVGTGRALQAGPQFELM
jgi:ATP-dependent Lon protease